MLWAWGMAAVQASRHNSLCIYHIAGQMNPVRRGALVNPALAMGPPTLSSPPEVSHGPRGANDRPCQSLTEDRPRQSGLKTCPTSSGCGLNTPLTRGPGACGCSCGFQRPLTPPQSVNWHLPMRARRSPEGTAGLLERADVRFASAVYNSRSSNNVVLNTTVPR